ncbi:questin oxidase family protein [Ketogulonicigenium vulgare]|uniref:questin oxidase family protein n=1 Tax=Ketogulonicigenium vulgare TaxID=92945 RepID=UPI0001E67ED1|nr:questin oxidase family protein [Ketogulonicigenium vulgare]ADO42797.1 conserved hypothetical protein [Ketogulonicigenium vulgare Y25]ALJ81134.1 hypothetical protein KVH_08060 [Ketogulonicigenium vulgare]ANW33883.1 hypothetical protein KvSKV_08030 [Ketogulonicigenium vulgare]AOZ54709.1 hypothetical protein KVC_1696 [Ketogulonicigenium vulgare]
MTALLPHGPAFIRAQRDSFEFPYLLANHAPMVLEAMRQMGASNARIADWYAAYVASKNVPPQAPPQGTLNADTWRGALGDRAREADLRDFFTAEAARLGPDGAIRLYLPEMAQGMAGSAIHPLMRMAYGVIGGNTAEIGHALGYWAATYLHVPLDHSATARTHDPLDVITGVYTLPGADSYQVEVDLLWHNIRAVCGLPGFASLAGSLDMVPDTPRQMAAAALALYAQTMDFSALHAVTGLHWLRTIAPHLDDPMPLYPVLWAIIASLIPKIGFPTLPTAEALEVMRQTPAPDWPAIFAAACASDDEHDISLTFSAYQEQQIWGDPLYQVVAARRVGLIT